MKTSKRTNLVVEILLVIIAIYFISPFIYMFFSSLKTETEAIAYPPKLFPEVWRFSNYVEAWRSQPFNTFLLNTVLVTVLTTLGQLVSCSLVAYGFARFEFKGDYSRAAEPPVRCGESHLSGLTEPPSLSIF